MALEIRKVAPGDRAGWDTLYAAYAAFYEVAQTNEMRDRVWGWLMDDAHEVQGLIALRDARPVGLAHIRPFARPLAAAKGLFLDDLFVAPEGRGAAVGAALIAETEAQAQRCGASVVRWITADDNYRARGLYDRLAERTMWVTYDMDVTSER